MIRSVVAQFSRYCLVNSMHAESHLRHRLAVSKQLLQKTGAILLREEGAVN